MSARNAAPLFTPVTLGALSLRNRMVMAPMTRSRADKYGVPSDLAVKYYADRAGAGLIITEGTQPSVQGQGYCRTPGIYNGDQIAAWRRITDAVHAKGGKIALQIMHVGRIGHHHNQVEPVGFVAPSAIAAKAQMYTDVAGMQPMDTPREATLADIADLIEQHRVATRNALAAGFDGVELHGANGYLGQQFLSTGTNHRTDAYGGSPENRSRFVLEVLDAMIAEAPGRVGLRISPGGENGDLTDADPQATYTALLKALETRDLAWVHVNHTAWDQTGLYALVKAPLIVCGNYDADKAVQALAAHPVAAVAFGRPYLANPDLDARFAAGAELNQPDFTTLFTPGDKGFNDYPALNAR
jgi:N-ethylmaleimide reductase